MASILSGPIPQHPMFNKSGTSSTPRMGPRIKPEASSFASHGQKGTVGNIFEITGTSCFASTSGTKIKKDPKDHVAENVKRMRQIQRKCRQKQKEEVETAPTPVKALWKSEKYECVPSKLSGYLNNSDTPRPRSTSFLRAHSRTGIPPAPPRPQSSRTPRTPPAPRVSSPKPDHAPNVERLEGFPARRSSSMSDLSATGKQMNFIKINALAASRQQVKRPPSQQSLEDSMNVKADRYNEYKRNVKGSVPKYLEKRKEEWKNEEVERIRNTPDPDMPPGHKLMPSEERCETLNLLHQSHKELSSKLSSLPIRSDTMRVRTAKEQLESKLCEVEEAIKVFSRPKVFVKIDD
ncbi:enkurin domain-containing protein 1-like [Watersipora subatra]|uniref:enkurin domain-containing protein 1-like n=1 Tax=Watersipora subatra TaxID=2589382 RepID=UPI00355BDC40